MTNAEARIIRLEQLMKTKDDAIMRLQDQVRDLQQGQRLLQAQAGGYGGVGGGGGGAFYVRAVDAVVVAGGATGTADVYTRVSGTETLVASGATLRNVAAPATTTGKVIFVAPYGDGSYQINGQACS